MGDISDIIGGDVDTTTAQSADFQPIPPGWYNAMVEKSEIHPTKAGDGKYLKLQLAIVGEKFEGRKVFTNINLVNPNPKAVEIGAREIAQLGAACGLLRLSDSTELLDKVIQVKVAVREGRNGGDPDNEVKGYKALSGAPAPAPVAKVAAAPETATAPKAAPKAAGKLPWER